MRATGFRLEPDWDIAGTVGSRGMATISFEFGEEWEGLAKRITFFPKGENSPVTVILNNDDDEVVLPSEVFLHPGEATFVIDGVGEGDVRLITLRGRLRVLDTGVPGGAEPAEPTPTELEQIRVALSDLAYELDEKIDALGGGGEGENNIAVIDEDGGICDSGISVFDVLTDHPAVQTDEDEETQIGADNGGSFTVIADIDRDCDGHVVSAEYTSVTLPRRRSAHFGKKMKFFAEAGTVLESADSGEGSVTAEVFGKFALASARDSVGRTNFYVDRGDDEEPPIMPIMPGNVTYLYLAPGDVVHFWGGKPSVSFVKNAIPEESDVPEYRTGDVYINTETGELFTCTARENGRNWSEWEYSGKLLPDMPLASESKAGGVCPVEKEDYMTVPVGMDPDTGRLYTMATGVPEPTSWAEVQAVVRAGLAPKVFKVGDQLTCVKNGQTLTWDIIGFDHDVPANEELTHSMTLLLHNAFMQIVFDEPDALKVTESGLPAGTYYFTLPIGYETDYIESRNLQFTLASPVAAGGKLRLRWKSKTAADTATVESLTPGDAGSVIESVPVTYGNSGTRLNYSSSIVRLRNGSSNWKISTIRQFLNSDADAGEVWTPCADDDLPPGWYATLPGFLSGMDEDFLAVIGKVKRYSEDTEFARGKVQETEDKVFLLAGGEVNANLTASADDSEPYEFFAQNSVLTSPGNSADTGRIKRNANGDAVLWVLLTPKTNTNNLIYYVHTGGAIYCDVADNERYYCVPACCVV